MMMVAGALSALLGSRSFWTRTYPLACNEFGSYLYMLDQSYTNGFVEVVSSGMLRKCQFSSCSVIYSCMVMMPVCAQFRLSFSSKPSGLGLSCSLLLRSVCPELKGAGIAMCAALVCYSHLYS